MIFKLIMLLAGISCFIFNILRKNRWNIGASLLILVGILFYAVDIKGFGLMAYLLGNVSAIFGYLRVYSPISRIFWTWLTLSVCLMSIHIFAYYKWPHIDKLFYISAVLIVPFIYQIIKNLKNINHYIPIFFLVCIEVFIQIIIVLSSLISS